MDAGTLDFRMRVKSLRKVRLHFEQLRQTIALDGCIDVGSSRFRAADKIPPNSLRLFGLRLKIGVAGRLQLGFEVIAAFFFDALAVGHGDASQQQQPLEIAFANRHLAFDRAIHDRLRERRLVPFVVTVQTIAIHVDDDVAAELAAEIDARAAPLARPLRGSRR